MLCNLRSKKFEFLLFSTAVELTRSAACTVAATTPPSSSSSSSTSLAAQKRVLNARQSKRRGAESVSGHDAVDLSEELLSDCVYLFAVGHRSSRLADVVQLRESASFTALAHKAYALRRVRRLPRPPRPLQFQPILFFFSLFLFCFFRFFAFVRSTWRAWTRTS